MSDQPNILFIMTDQQRWDALGCSGGWVRTPNLDRKHDPEERHNLAGRAENRAVEDALRLRLLERVVDTQVRC